MSKHQHIIPLSERKSDTILAKAFYTSINVTGPKFGVERNYVLVPVQDVRGVEIMVPKYDDFYRPALYLSTGTVLSDKRLPYGEAMIQASKWSQQYGAHRSN